MQMDIYLSEIKPCLSFHIRRIAVSKDKVDLLEAQNQHCFFVF